MPVFLDTRGSSNIGIGICDRCRLKYPLVDLHSDPNTPGLMVCNTGCADQYDPYRLPAPPVDKINLPFVRPDAPLTPGPAPAPPLNLAAPTVSGTPEVGDVLTCSTGVWSGYPAPTYSYEWQRDGADLIGETANTYTLVSGDVSHLIGCVVTATNVVGNAFEPSNTLGPVIAAPVNLIAPVVSGTPTLGDALSSTTGTWSGYPVPTYGYQWQRDGVNIGGATANTYVLITADVSHLIGCVVTATNVVGNASDTSNSLGPGTAPPLNLAAPTVSGTPEVGDVLTCSTGVWSGYPAPTYSYEWQRDGADLIGETANTYTLVSGDVSHLIGCVVTATNVVGNAFEPSNTLAVGAPVNAVPPAVTGTATVGEDLACSTGTWTGFTPITYTYQWQRDGIDISGATTDTYTLVTADIAHLIDCVVTATNIIDAASEPSNSVGPVDLLPANTVAPVASGTPEVGDTLTVTSGTWTGYPAPTFGYQWRRDGTPISGATVTTYLLVSADDTHTVDCLVTGTNTAGSASADSNDIGPITSVVAPVNTVAPVISGTATVGQTLTSTTGTWTGTPTPTYTYQWKRNGSDISGATASTYALVQADAAASITCAVTGTNVAGSATASSNVISPIYDADAQAYITSAGELFPVALNNLVVGLKSASLWTILGAIKKALGTPSLATSLIDLRNPAFNGTSSGTPTRSATAGWTFDEASSQYIDTKWKVGATNSNATQNSVHIGFRLRAIGGTGTFYCGAYATGILSVLGFPGVSDGSTSFFGNDNIGNPVIDSTTPAAPANIVGTRTGVNAEAVYRDGSSVATGTASSVTTPDFSSFLGAVNVDGSAAAFGDGRVTLWHAGGALTGTQAAALNTLFNTYAVAAGET